MSLEQQRFNAQKWGDTAEAARLDRLMARLDSQRMAYGKAQRGEQ
jgi:hypothetical protein